MLNSLQRNAGSAFTARPQMQGMNVVTDYLDQKSLPQVRHNESMAKISTVFDVLCNQLADPKKYPVADELVINFVNPSGSPMDAGIDLRWVAKSDPNQAGSACLKDINKTKLPLGLILNPGVTAKTIADQILCCAGSLRDCICNLSNSDNN